jgi:hypothetical protein
MYTNDIDKGTLGLAEVVRTLNGMRVGISCLTPENLDAAWILYEAGALAKAIDDRSRLCTYLLCGLRPEDVRVPLGMFQATKAEKDDTRKLLSSINRAITEDPVSDRDLDQIFAAMWPILEDKLRHLPDPERIVEAQRDPNELLAEILEIVRSEANKRRKVDALDAFLPIFDELLPTVPHILNAARTFRIQTTVGMMTANSAGGSSVAGALNTTEPPQTSTVVHPPSDEQNG